MADNFWLTDEQFAALAPHLPMVHTGPERQDDRRIISGIVHRLREGCRWRALPDEYGPYTTVFNRYNRWSQRGLWQRLFAALVECADPPALTMIDSSAVKAHRSASGAQKGGSKTKPLADRAAAHDQDPCHRRRGRPTARLPADGRKRRRYQGRRAFARIRRGEQAHHRRQGIRRRSFALLPRRPQHDGGHPQQIQPEASLPFRRGALSASQRHRAHLLPLEGFSRHRNPIRQNRPQFPRRPLPGRCTLLLEQLSPDPRERIAHQPV